jgi:hypothetical protein
MFQILNRLTHAQFRVPQAPSLEHERDFYNVAVMSFAEYLQQNFVARRLKPDSFQSPGANQEHP